MPSWPSRCVPVGPTRPSISPSVYIIRLHDPPSSTWRRGQRACGSRPSAGPPSSYGSSCAGPSVASDQRGRVARQAEPGAPAVGGDVDRAERREDLLALPLVLQNLLERGEQFVAAEPCQRQRPPRDAQFDAERRLVRAVAADVADHRVDGAVGSTDRVVEVPAEQRTAAAGAVAGGEPQIGALQQRGGQQAAFQPGVLLGAQFRLGELVLRRCRRVCARRRTGWRGSAAARPARRGRGSPGRRRVPPRRPARCRPPR